MTYKEDAYLPFSASHLPKGKWLVIAPHPDDETFGMGGAISLNTKSGGVVDVIVLTDGQRSGDGEDLTRRREKEAISAAEILGCREILFLREVDRELRPREDLINKIASIMDHGEYKVLFFPSPYEPHPDHRAAAQIAWEAARKSKFCCRVLSYEISTQGPCNILLDIGEVVQKKIEAAVMYQSQMRVMPYLNRIIGLNQARTWSLPANVEFAEAFFEWRALDAPLSVQLFSQCMGRVSEKALPTKEKLVTVIIRTADRPTLLREAIKSVINQNYHEIELVIVNDGFEEVYSLVCEEFQNRLREFKYRRTDFRGSAAHAANVGLEMATGEYVLFLDDDDLLLPGCVATLVRGLEENSRAIAVYGSVVGQSCQGDVAEFGAAFDKRKLLLGNYIPIHSILFRRRALADGLRFDETLKYCEDWDFWLQLSRKGDFFFVRDKVAIYRIHSGQRFGIEHDPELLRTTSLPIYKKWVRLWSEDELYFVLESAKRGMELEEFDRVLVENLPCLSTRLERLEYCRVLSYRLPHLLKYVSPLGAARYLQNSIENINILANILEDIEAVGRGGVSVLDKFKLIKQEYVHAADCREKLANLGVKLEELEAQLVAIYSSRSWRYTAFFRFVGWGLRRFFNCIFRLLGKTGAR